MLMDLSNSQLVLLLAILFLAYGFRGVTGFGSGTISIPLMTLFMPLVTVLPIISMIDASAAIIHGSKHRKQISWQHILPLVPTMLIGITIAIFLLKTIDTTLLSKALGIYVLVFATYSLLSPEFKRTISPHWCYPAGLAGGIISTLFGTGSLVYATYLQLRALPKGVFRATVATVFAVEGWLRVISYSLAGMYHREILLAIGAFFPVMLVAMYIGGRIHTSISQQQFQRAVALLLLLSGTALLFK